MREAPALTPKDGGNLAACHFPLTDAEAADRTAGGQRRRAN